MHSHRSDKRTSIAIVGGDTLLGKEVHEVLAAAKIPANIELVASFDAPKSSKGSSTKADAGKTASILALGAEEPLVMVSIEAAELDAARIVILSASKEAGLKAYERIRGADPVPLVIDLTGALEELPGSRLRAPMVEAAGFEVEASVQTIAQPAAIAIALLLTHLQKAGPVRQSVVEVFEPVSERGTAGIDELQKQTVGLLSFKPLPKEIFDAQLSFSMLPQYGSESPYSLEEIELKVDRHLASLLAPSGLPMPSLRLIQAPVFHGYSISAWVEFEQNPGMNAIFQALGSSSIDVRTKDHEPPTNVGVAGQSGISVGSIAQDRNQPRAWWFWVAADNLHIAAENAREVVRENLD